MLSKYKFFNNGIVFYYNYNIDDWLDNANKNISGFYIFT